MLDSSSCMPDRSELTQPCSAFCVLVSIGFFGLLKLKSVLSIMLSDDASMPSDVKESGSSLAPALAQLSRSLHFTYYFSFE